MLLQFRITLFICFCFGLSACLDTSGPGGFVVEGRIDGSFKGSAGENWSKYEISLAVAKDVCDGVEPRRLNLDKMGSRVTFSGVC